MRNLLLAVVCGLLVSANSGCLLPLYSGDPSRRTQELMFTSENLRLFCDEWERAWLLDMPNQCTPMRVHGGIM
jgi:hypothetical protein